MPNKNMEIFDEMQRKDLTYRLKYSRLINIQSFVWKNGDYEKMHWN